MQTRLAESEKWNKSAIFSLINSISGLLALLLLLANLILAEYNSTMEYLLFLTLVPILIVISGFSIYSTRISLREEYNLPRVIQSFHRINAALNLLAWLIWLPALLGLGMGQLFFIISGFVLFALPSSAIMYIQRIPFYMREKKMPWNQWMAEKALQDDAE